MFKLTTQDYLYFPVSCTFQLLPTQIPHRFLRLRTPFMYRSALNPICHNRVAVGQFTRPHVAASLRGSATVLRVPLAAGDSFFLNVVSK